MSLLDICIQGVDTVQELSEKSRITREEMLYFLDLFEKYGWLAVNGETLTLNLDEMKADRPVVSRVFVKSC